MAETLWARLEAKLEAALQTAEEEKEERIEQHAKKVADAKIEMNALNDLFRQLEQKRDQLKQVIANDVADVDGYDTIITRIKSIKRPLYEDEYFDLPPPQFSMDCVCARHRFVAISCSDNITLESNVQLMYYPQFKQLKSLQLLQSALHANLLNINSEEVSCYISWKRCGDEKCEFCENRDGPTTPPTF
jgi:hypothetical protein